MALSSSDFISLFICPEIRVWLSCSGPDAWLNLTRLFLSVVKSEASRGSWVACCMAYDFPVVER